MALVPLVKMAIISLMANAFPTAILVTVLIAICQNSVLVARVAIILKIISVFLAKIVYQVALIAVMLTPVLLVTVVITLKIMVLVLSVRVQRCGMRGQIVV